MKTAIIYESYHHGNTKKLLDAIVKKHEVTLFDARQVLAAELSDYDLIGIASGIAFGKYYKNVAALAAKSLPEKKDVFLIFTSGNGSKEYGTDMEKLCEKKQCRVVGKYGCSGFDTVGPFKLIGGVSKGHPTSDEIAGAAAFYESLIKQERE
ncbi:MAG: flavodoxin domain-containing protein [Eubacteriales bacterium]|nr:flavodoxin domain-containing protein [Eubacteriales bacterium]